MAQRTLKGYQLAEALRGRRTHLWVDVEECSLICRAAVTYLHVQEGHCNGHPAMSSPYIDVKEAGKLQDRFERQLEKKEAQLEKRITALAKNLIHFNHRAGVKSVHFGGDPRGATVKLVMRDGRTDDWGAEGICVPGS